VHRDAWAYVSRLRPGAEASHPFGEGRGGYLYVIEGDLGAGKERLATGDAAKIAEERSVELRAEDATELLLVDVPLSD
jgi:redox-sensitive bicupin YhaK (pirin superfamily)